MIFGTVSAVEGIAPVQGLQPSERMRQSTDSGCSSAPRGMKSCSTGISDWPRTSIGRFFAKYSETIGIRSSSMYCQTSSSVQLERGKDADALARRDARVVEVPQFGTLILRVPLSARVAKREDALLCARPLLVAPRAAERGVVAAFAQCIEECVRLQALAAEDRADRKWIRAVGQCRVIGMHAQIEAELARMAVAKLDHLPELVSGVDVQERKRRLLRMEGLLREAQHDRGVLADRIQHDRALELGHDLAEDVNALRFQRTQVIVLCHVSHKTKAPPDCSSGGARSKSMVVQIKTTPGQTWTSACSKRSSNKSGRSGRTSSLAREYRRKGGVCQAVRTSALADKLDVVSVGVENEAGVVVRVDTLQQLWRAVVRSTCNQCRAMGSIDQVASGTEEGVVWARRGRFAWTKPKVEASRICSEPVGVPFDVQRVSQRCQRSAVEPRGNS